MAAENDIVLIHFENKPLSFARIESIEPDIKRDWYHVKLLLLQVPLQVVTWILRNAYINGEPFTMDGKQMRLEKIECPPDPERVDREAPKRKPAAGKQNSGNKKIISLSDLKKK
jgi:hypothetical protein